MGRLRKASANELVWRGGTVARRCGGGHKVVAIASSCEVVKQIGLNLV